MLEKYKSEGVWLKKKRWNQRWRPALEMLLGKQSPQMTQLKGQVTRRLFHKELEFFGLVTGESIMSQVHFEND